MTAAMMTHTGGINMESSLCAKTVREGAGASLPASNGGYIWQKRLIKGAKTVIVVAPLVLKHFPKVALAIVAAEAVINVVEIWMEEKDGQ